MNRSFLIILTILAGIFLAGCHRDDEPQTARRTILVYMAAKNNLSYYATLDISEMMRAEIPADCRLLVFRSTYDYGTELFEIKGGQMKTLKTYEEGTLAADAETLTRVLVDARRLAPARENGIIFWSHSTGWHGAVKAPALNRSFGQEQGHVIELPELQRALSTAPKFNFIFFDSCYMGGVEVAYQLRDCADYMVGSVCEVPSTGMPYNLTLPSLFSTDIVGGLIEAIDINVDYYLDRPRELCPSTLSLINMSKVEALAEASRPLYVNAKEPGETLQYFSVTKPYSTLFADLKQYMELTARHEDELVPFERALAEAVIRERHTSTIWGQLPIDHCCGLSVNPSPHSADYGYMNLAWFKDVIESNGLSEN